MVTADLYTLEVELVEHLLYLEGQMDRFACSFFSYGQCCFHGQSPLLCFHHLSSEQV